LGIGQLKKNKLTFQKKKSSGLFFIRLPLKPTDLTKIFAGISSIPAEFRGGKHNPKGMYY
jgi:hypothetical protein